MSFQIDAEASSLPSYIPALQYAGDVPRDCKNGDFSSDEVSIIHRSLTTEYGIQVNPLYGRYEGRRDNGESRSDKRNTLDFGVAIHSDISASGTGILQPTASH